jgi:hypothetical protein
LSALAINGPPCSPAPGLRPPAAGSCARRNRRHGRRHRHHLAGQHGARLEAPAQANGRGLNETPFDHGVQPFRPGQHLHLRGEAGLLAERRQLNHVEHAVRGAQRFQADSQRLRALVVHLEREHRDPLVLPPSPFLLISDHAQHVADAGEAPGAETMAGGAEAPGAGRQARLWSEMPQDRGAGRGDALAGDAVVVQGKALEQAGGGRRWDGQETMTGRDPAAADRQGPNRPA